MTHFKKLSQVEHVQGQGPSFDPRVIQHSVNEEINVNFTSDEVLSVIKKLKNNKACGVDNVVNEYLKNCPDSVVLLVVNMFNLVLNTGIVPSDWCIGIIKPLYKNKGSVSDPDNYRGISLLSCIGKLFTACINARLTLFIESVGILGEEQAGFRGGYGTTDHIFVLNSLIDLYLFKKQRIYCAFVDYKKAFDLVDRSSLWHKLIGSHINGNILRVIYNMYDNAKSCVKSGNCLSEMFSCNIGVRQGENLSPLLFAIYLNDFELYLSTKYKGLQSFSDDINRLLSDDDVEYFLKMFVLLYADDTIVLAESAEELQLALNAVYDYCNQWYLYVNTSKTKIVIFSRGKVRKHPDFHFGESIISVVEDYVYLGTTFNYNGSQYKAISKQVSQARRAMFSLLTKARRLDLPIDVLCELFEKMVLPILLYGCEVWGYADVSQIEVFYRKFLRNLLCMCKFTPNCMVYGEVGKTKIATFIEKRMFCYWVKVTEGKASKLSSLMYRLLYRMYLNNEYESTWIVKVRSILDHCGLSYIWLDQDVLTDKRTFTKLVYERLDDIDAQNWSAEVSTHRNCQTYKMVKSGCHFENYLLHLNFDERVKLTKFRCGNHRLPVNENRFTVNSLPVICKLCNLNEVGDEFHYLFNCPAFCHNRQIYLKKLDYNSPDMHKMQNLFNTTDIKQLSDLAKFVTLIMSRFS